MYRSHSKNGIWSEQKFHFLDKSSSMDVIDVLTAMDSVQVKNPQNARHGFRHELLRNCVHNEREKRRCEDKHPPTTCIHFTGTPAYQLGSKKLQ